ncbi:MAG TPA: PVC-type heme-binding CxxCH protein, partial [Pirellulales bacterium]|nr:PVC-type heme-binding CxxCH protein [Pirellulales bacterium]
MAVLLFRHLPGWAVAKPPSAWALEKAAEGFTAPPGFHVSVVAKEPAVSQPIGMSIDERGRLWVAECRSYPDWSQRSDDRVLIFADNDGNGSLETRTVFADHLSNLSGIAVGLGGAWLLCSPELLFIPDRDGDGRPDGPPLVVLNGWDAQPRLAHHVANHLLFGPDGWLYGCLGGASDSLVGTPTTPQEKRVSLDAAIWRVHPETHRFEVVADGTCNPFGIDFDETGELFASNNVLAHLWHILPGGRYERANHTAWENDTCELMTACTDHNHWSGSDDWHLNRNKTRAAGGGHVHAGLIVYQGDDFPVEYHGTAMLGNLLGSCVNFDRFEPSHGEVVARHGDNLIESSDPSFRPVDLKDGPDGSVLVCDWNAVGSCHSSDSAAKEPTGRIYRISYGEPPAVPVDLVRLGDEELVALNDHRNDWFVRRARLVLQHRAQLGKLAPATRQRLALQARDAKRPTTARLRSLWTWHVVRQGDRGDGETEPELLRALLADSAPEMRAWSVRLLAEDQPVPATT